MSEIAHQKCTTSQASWLFDQTLAMATRIPPHCCQPLLPLHTVTLGEVRPLCSQQHKDRPNQVWGGGICIGKGGQVRGLGPTTQVYSYWVEKIARCSHKIGRSILRAPWCAQDCEEILFQKVTQPYPFRKEWTLGTGLTGCQRRWTGEEKLLTGLCHHECVYMYV